MTENDLRKLVCATRNETAKQSKILNQIKQSNLKLFLDFIKYFRYVTDIQMDDTGLNVLNTDHKIR